MALFNHIKTAGQMDPVEIAKAEALYQRYMEGEKKRIQRIHIGIDFGFDMGSINQLITSMKHINDKMMIISAGGIQSGRTAMAIQMASLMAERPVIIRREMDDEMIHRRLEIFHVPGMFSGINDAFEQLKEVSTIASHDMKWLSSEAEKIQRLEDYDEPVNFCHGEVPPKQKKLRSYVPDKRAINRRNRKSKRK